MEFDTPLWKVLQLFFSNPYHEVYLRELARKADASVFSVKRIVDELVKEGMLLERKNGNMRYIKANMDNLFFRYLKIAFSIKKIEESGLIEYLIKNIPALSSIILFGSIAKGEDDEKSDVDLLVIGQKKKMDLSKFEENMGREVRVITMRWSEWREYAKENKAFYREIITNGIVLYGNMPVIE
ncbi:MAG TPA: nucleotidyltransferase domain-containing protein [Thermoplasmatales archaeon]|nr:nucleotidyltransferase domain-containing protein [Thermoplasmatales archaeon]